VLIDRPELANGLDSAHMARRVRSATDDPGTAGKNRDKTVGGGGHPDSSPASLDSAVRIERTVAYRDAVYQKYAADHGRARVWKLEREALAPAICGTETKDAEPHQVAPEDGLKGKNRTAMVAQLATGDEYDGAVRTMPVLVRNASRCGYTTAGAPEEYVPTGARGPASGREFDPEAAGGPIQQLDAGKARITNEGVQEVAAHLQRFTGGGPLEGPEQAMLDRLTSIAAGDIESTSYDQSFYTHELDEAGRYAELGFGPESGKDLGSPDMYDVWNDVHTAALEDYGISGADLFYPGLAP
jgi:hypothetical protein